MANKELLTMIKNGHPFSIQYGKTSFFGTLAEFSEQCRSFIDYAKKPYNYFGFAVVVNGHEYEIESGWKSILLSAVK